MNCKYCDTRSHQDVCRKCCEHIERLQSAIDYYNELNEIHEEHLTNEAAQTANYITKKYNNG
jgi:hypothetical protein